MPRINFFLFLYLLATSPHLFAASLRRNKPSSGIGVSSRCRFNPFRLFGSSNRVIPVDNEEVVNFGHEAVVDDSSFCIKPGQLVQFQSSIEASLRTTLSESSSSFLTRRSPSHNQNPSSTTMTLLLLLHLPEVLIQEIFQFIYTDYRLLRSICHDFRQLYDDFILRTVRLALSSELGSIEAYKLIDLAMIILRSTPEAGSPKKAQEQPQTNLKQSAISFASNLAVINDYYRGLATLLKCEIISWSDVEADLTGRIETFRKIYSLGLVVFARELYKSSPDLFFRTVDYEHQNIVLVILNRHYQLARFLIQTLHHNIPTRQIFSAHPQYLLKVVDGLIDANYWDLLEIVYRDNPSFDYSDCLQGIAEKGSVQGLLIFKDLYKAHPQGIAHIAASEGHLDFLIQLDAMGILSESAGPDGSRKTALHTAARFGRVDCLLFLVRTLGTHWLDTSDVMGYMPIHMAVLSNNPTILQQIILLNPRYTHHNRFKSFFFGILSPLKLAVASNLLNSAKVLLASFPELILIKKRGDTLIHLAVIKGNLEMLKLLLSSAPHRIITAQNLNGNTALHLLCQISTNSDFIAAFLDTNQFSGLERNHDGLTPIGIFARRNPLYKIESLLKIFRIDFATLNEAIACRR